MTLLEEIRDLYSRLAQLTLDELADLRGKIVEYANSPEADADTPESVAILNEVADIGDAAKAREGEIKAATEQAAADKAAAKERIEKINAEEDPEAPEPPASPPEGEETPAEGDETPAPVEGEEVPEPVAASGGRRAGTTISRIAANRRPGAQGSPEIPVGNRTSLTASGALNGLDRGAPIGDRWELAEAMSRTLTRMDRRSKPTGDVVLASAEWDYPEDRQLTMDQLRDAKVLDAVVHPQALVATGGICAPVNVDWSLDTWAVADRPIRDGLPGFQATRGGLIFRTPPDVSALSGATGIWTEATDLSPGASTKPVIAIACPGTQTVYTSAVSTRLGFGNMESMFDPETVAANTDLAIAAAARIAENNLFTQIQAQCTLGIEITPALLGANRDWFAALDRISAGFRNLHRVPDSQVLTIILPAWFKHQLRADRARELAHDNDGTDPLAVPDEYIESLFSIRQINPIWHLDGVAAGGTSTGAYANQYFGAFATNTAVPAYPATMNALMFIEGSVQFLDAGRLDLGVVRDSTLDATNDYETFVETFENVAYRGFSGGALQISAALLATGGSAGSVTSTQN